MFDLGTLGMMNDRAYEEYLLKKPVTALEALRRWFDKARPPSISAILSFFRNAETYVDFVGLVKEYLPERETEILAKPTANEQIACFASHFEDRYLPLDPYFRDGDGEGGYGELLSHIPLIVMGFSYEDYHQLSDLRPGIQFMSYLFEPPGGDEDAEGERVALADGFKAKYQVEAKRVPAGGITLKAAQRIFTGNKWAPLRHWAEYLNNSTGNGFLDTDQEMLGNSVPLEWDKEEVEGLTKLWLEANALYDRMMKFAAWLEDEKDGPAHFRETIDFLLAHLQEGDLHQAAPPQGCSRGMMMPPQARNT